MDDIRLKLRYKKIDNASWQHIQLTIESVRYDESGCISHGNANFFASQHPVGFVWDVGLIDLERIANIIARINNRKNVCSTEAESGLLY